MDGFDSKIKNWSHCSRRKITAGGNTHNWIHQLRIQHRAYLALFFFLLTIAFLTEQATIWQEKAWQNLALHKQWFKVQNEHIAKKPLQGIKKDYPSSLRMNNGWQNNIPSISVEKGRVAVSYRCTMASKSSYSVSPFVTDITHWLFFILIRFCQSDKPCLRQQQNKGHCLDCQASKLTSVN